MDAGVAGIIVRRAAGLPCPPPGMRMTPDARLAPGFCIGYRDGVVAWTGALSRLGDAPALDDLVLNPTDIALIRAACGAP